METGEEPPTKSITFRTFWMLVLLVPLFANIPGVASALVEPLDQFDTLAHNMCHALVAILTGGWIFFPDFFPEVFAHCPRCLVGGVFEGHFFGSISAPLFLQAGYVGTLLAGCLLIYFGRFSRTCKRALCAIGGCIAAESVLLFGMSLFDPNAFANPDSSLRPALIPFGLGTDVESGPISFAHIQLFVSILWGFGVGAFLLWVGLKWQHARARLVLLLIAAQLALNSLSAVFIELKVWLRGFDQTALTLDPCRLAQHFSSWTIIGSTYPGGLWGCTGVPAMFWSLLWLSCSIAMLRWTLKRTYGADIFAHGPEASGSTATNTRVVNILGTILSGIILGANSIRKALSGSLVSSNASNDRERDNGSTQRNDTHSTS